MAMNVVKKAPNKDHVRYKPELRYALSEEAVFEAARRGLTLADIAKAIGCSAPTVRSILNEREDLQLAWERGHSELLGELCNHMIERAFENDIILMFTLKTRFNFVEYQHVVNREREAETPKVNIYLPDNQRDVSKDESDG